MRRLALLLFLLPPLAGADTITRADLVGNWVTSPPRTLSEHVAGWLLGHGEDRLDISADGGVTYARGNGTDRQVLHADPAMVATHDDLIIIAFGPAAAPNYKLVLSGWKIQAGQMLFGELYIYDGGALVNGIPVSFERGARGGGS